MVTRAAICGSDLWPYKRWSRAKTWPSHGTRIHRHRRGCRRRRPHAEGGRSRRRAVRCTQTARASSAAKGFTARACTAGGGDGTASMPARARRCASHRRTERSSSCPWASDDALMPSLLTLSDVMGTGHHAALAARVSHGNSVAVVGDGAVGLCGVIAARRLGAEQIILLGPPPGPRRARQAVRRHRHRQRARRGGGRARARARPAGSEPTPSSNASASSHPPRRLLASRAQAARSAASAFPRHASIPAAVPTLLPQRRHRRRPCSGSRVHRGAPAGCPRR